MANLFLTATPADLLTMVQEGVECERCYGTGDSHYETDCDTCSGTGKTPLSNSDLDALAACVCDGEWVKFSSEWPRAQSWTIRKDGRASAQTGYRTWQWVSFYTTSPDAAMRLQVKYDIDTMHLDGNDADPNCCWHAGAWVWPVDAIEAVKIDVYVEHAKDATDDEKQKVLCCAITEAALIAALTEGGGDAGD